MLRDPGSIHETGKAFLTTVLAETSSTYSTGSVRVDSRWWFSGDEMSRGQNGGGWLRSVMRASLSACSYRMRRASSADRLRRLVGIITPRSVTVVAALRRRSAVNGGDVPDRQEQSACRVGYVGLAGRRGPDHSAIR
jgi:hypothetical protein